MTGNKCEVRPKKIDPLFSVERPYIKNMCAYSLFIGNIPHIFFSISKFTNRLHCIAHPSYDEILSQRDDDPPTHDKLLDAKNSSKVSEFHDNHVISRIYFFQVREDNQYLSWPCPKLMVSFTITKGYILKKEIYPLFWIMSRSPHMVLPTIQKLKRL